MEYHPFTNEVFCYDKKKYWKSPTMLFQFINYIRKRKFDLAIVPATVSLSATSDLLALLSGANMRVGAASLNGIPNPRVDFFTHSVDLLWDDDPHRHQVLRNMDILAPLGIKSEDLSLTIGITPDERKYAEAEAASLRGNKPYLVGIHPGAGKLENRWQPKNFAEMANKLANEKNASVVVTVGPMDDEPYDYFCKHLLASHEVIYKKPLRTVAAIISKLDLFITNDTGIMHVAGAVGVPMIALFGKTDPLQWAPNGPNVRYINISDEDVNVISPETVWMEVESILAEIPPHNVTHDEPK
jgi:ADP-heptose:LPS heptosyltransferase